ncbi:MAG TPA: saccharopine dehydrogenase C-terminal domain-containing protein [Cryomorphaceae bacterium]|nr:saccharopine dehydrogenase C-terminal domain-containing protein [Cryomorphaceae bacterium]
MHKILVMGAGRSAISLIDYLIDNAEKESWSITVADANKQAAESMVAGRGKVSIVETDATSESARRAVIEETDLVISMLPAFLHVKVAHDCLELKKNLITPSYISDEMKEMASDVESAGLSFMNELGVDPGIDHMSAMRLLDTTRDAGNEITCFESFTGGLVAPESDNNPWNYKFTWNPRNVVLAGQGGAVKFKHNGRFKYIPYQRLFRRTEIIEIPKYGRFEGYANRDSLKYRELYDLMEVPTIYRGTLRRTGFCRAWNVFVQMGMTDDSYIMEGSDQMTHREFTNSFLAFNPDDSVELKLMHYMKLDQDSEITDKLKWLGIFDDTPIGLEKASTPAQILQKILEKKWTLSEGDKDMIVMWHKLKFKAPGATEEREVHSSMVVIGDVQPRTAMAKTVGLPVGIAAKLLLNGTISRKGVYAPMYKDIYEPILEELEKNDIKFEERELSPQEKKIV